MKKTLAAYKIELKARYQKKLGKKDQFIKLIRKSRPISFSDLGLLDNENEKKTYLEAVRELLLYFSDIHHGEEGKHVAQLVGKLSASGFYLYGRLSYGVYGEPKAELINVEEGFVSDGDLTPGHAVTRPHAFMFYLPDHSHDAFLCVQQYGRSSAKGVLDQTTFAKLKELVNPEENLLTVGLLYPRNYQKAQKKGSLDSVIVSYDIEGSYYDKEEKESDDKSTKKAFKAKVRAKIEIPKEGLLSKGKYAIDTFKKHKSEFLTIIPDGAQNQKTSLNVKIGDEVRKMTDLGEDKYPYFEINDEFDRASQQYPERSLDEAQRLVVQDEMLKVINLISGSKDQPAFEDHAILEKEKKESKKAKSQP